MFSKFKDGLVFGAGFGISIICIGYLWLSINSYFFSQELINNNNQISESEINALKGNSKDYNFYKDSPTRFEIPEGGGILSMSTTETPANQSRPNTFQIWLTNHNMWEIHTFDEDIQFVEIPYPKDDPYLVLEKIIGEKSNHGYSTTTIHSVQLQLLEQYPDSYVEQSINGKLNLSKDGILYVIPNVY